MVGSGLGGLAGRTGSLLDREACYGRRFGLARSAGAERRGRGRLEAILAGVGTGIGHRRPARQAPLDLVSRRRPGRAPLDLVSWRRAGLGRLVVLGIIKPLRVPRTMLWAGTRRVWGRKPRPPVRVLRFGILGKHEGADTPGKGDCHQGEMRQSDLHRSVHAVGEDGGRARCPPSSPPDRFTTGRLRPTCRARSCRSRFRR